MELRHLRYFLAVAQNEHFTRAAEELNVSQPALSQQVKQLEAELGTPLFDRLGRRVRLTAAGEIFRGSARRILDEVKVAETEISELETMESGVVTIGAVQTVNAYLMPSIVSSFRAAHPRVAVRVEELAAGEVERGVADGRLSLGLSFVPAQERSLVGEPLFDEELVLVTSSRHRLAKRRSVRMAALADEPLVLLPAKFCTRRLIDHAFETARVRPLVSVEMNSIEGILRIVLSTAGATIVPRMAVDTFRDSRLSAIRLLDPTPCRTVGIVWNAGGHRSAAARRFAVMAGNAVRTARRPQDAARALAADRYE